MEKLGRIRSGALGFMAAGLLALPAAGAPPPGPGVEGEIEGGYQQVSGDTSSAKFDEYRDVRSWIARGRFLIENGQQDHYLRGWFHDVGQKDEFYRLEGGRWGKWGLFGEFSELPHNLSNQSRTSYLGIQGGKNLTLPWNPSAPGFDLGTALDATLRGFDLGTRTLTGKGGGYFRPDQNVELSTSYRLIDKRGQDFIGGIGSSFAAGANFAQFPAPVDEQIHEIQAALGWKGESWSSSLSYLGNIYDNELDKGVKVANPLVATDGNSSSRWQYATEPDNQAHSFNLAGSLALPTEFSSRISGTFSYGRRFQNQDFLPQTINSTLSGDPSLVPSRSDLDGDIQTLLGDVRFTANPLEDLNLDFHYRIYDYDNKSDRIKLDATVVNDTGPIDDGVPGEADRFSVPNEYRTQNASLEGSYRLLDRATLGFGWGWEQWRRSSDREVRETNEHGPNLRLDYRISDRVQLRSSYAYETRSNSDYRADAYIKKSYNSALVVDAVSTDVFPELRKFPQAVRRQHVANLMAQFTPLDNLDFGVQGGLSVADYQNSSFGLTDDERWNLGTDLGYSPLEWLRFSAYYSFDRGLARQKSRERPPDDSGNNWTTRTTEWAHNAGFESFAELLPGKLDLEVRYDFQQGKVRTHSGGNNSLAENFPTTKNNLMLLATTLSYHWSEQLTLKAGYRLERYQQRDFQFDGIEPYSPAIDPSSIFLGNEVRDYRAHIYAISAVFEF
jgi:MtrB/PioB family decaheme-associated outer membrane protein